MSALRGSLGDVELSALVRFLATTQQTGTLRISQGRWVGEVAVNRGQISGASVGDERGPAALDAIALGLSEGEFVFENESPLPEANLKDDTREIPARLQAVADARRNLTGGRSLLSLVPNRLDVPPDLGELRLDLLTLRMLADSTGGKSVSEIADVFGLVRTVEGLIHLHALGLIRFMTSTSDGSPATPAFRTTGPRPVEGHAPRTRGPSSGTRAVRPNVPPANAPAMPPSLAANSGSERTSPTALAGGVVKRAPSDRVDAGASSPAAPAPMPAMAPWAAVVRNDVRPIVETALLAVIVYVCVGVVVQTFRVDGSSMTPTLTDGQLLVIEKPAYWRATGSILDALFPVDSQGSIRYLVGGPNRGDLAVFHSPTEPGVDLIKRIIGRPNDTVLIDHGDVWINGQRLEEPYVQSRYDSSFEYPANGQPLTVPDGFYFVLGDNRLDSYDSHLGWLVPAGDLIGRAWLSYWPSLTWGFPARGTIPSRNPDDAVAATASLPTEPTLPPQVTPTQSALASDVSPASSDVAQVGAQPTATSAIATTVRATVLLSPVSAPSPAPATAAAPIPSPTTASASRPAPPPTSTSAPAPVAGPGLQLVAQGFGQRQQTVGFGFVLQNASDVLASDHTTYSLSALDARGAILATTTGDVGVVLPRQRLGVGGTVAVPRGASVDRIAVSVAPAAYYFPWTSSAVALKPTDVTWQPGAAKAIATIVNPYAIGLNRVIVGAIARDATGSIVGGGSAIVDSLPQDARVTVEVPVAWAGTSAQVEVFATLPSLPRIE